MNKILVAGYTHVTLTRATKIFSILICCLVGCKKIEIKVWAKPSHCVSPSIISFQKFFHVLVKQLQLVTCFLFAWISLLVFLVWFSTLWAYFYHWPALLANLVRKVTHEDWLGAHFKTDWAF